MLATLSSKGQVTLPAPIREALKLETGARLDFMLQADGSIRIVPVTRDPLAIGAVLPPPRRSTPASQEEIRAGIAAHAARRLVRAGK